MKVYELLDSPEKWAKGYYAYNAKGQTSTEFAEEACKWCLSGAIYRCYSTKAGGRNPAEHSAVYQKVSEAIHKRDGNPYYSLPAWNDAPERTYEEVYNLVKELDV